MNMPNAIALLALSAFTSVSLAAEAPHYHVHYLKPNKSVSVAFVKFSALAGMNKTAVAQVNAALASTARSFVIDARKCKSAAQGRLWGYDITIDKVRLSANYVSVVFAKSTVCAGSPDIEKEARVFARSSGHAISARILFKQLIKAGHLVKTMSGNPHVVALDDELAERMISDSRAALADYDERCDFYLKHSVYRIWVDGRHLILFPEFIQPESFCQKEYLIDFAR